MLLFSPFCPLWSNLVLFSPFGPLCLLWFYLVLFNPFSPLWSISVLFRPFGSLWFYSVHFSPILSSLSTSVLFHSIWFHSIHSVYFGPIRSTLFLFGPSGPSLSISSNSVHSDHFISFWSISTYFKTYLGWNHHNLNPNLLIIKKISNS